MSNIIDYIKNYGDKSLHHFPLNELDITSINELSYLPIGEAIDKCDNSKFISLKEIFDVNVASFLKKDYTFMISEERVTLYHTMLRSRRFAELEIGYYVNDVNREIEQQFSAIVFRLPSINHIQVVFRGTDASLIGWKEDAKMTYMTVIPSQDSAFEYLNHFLSSFEGEVVVSGHSKGGNLAAVASSRVQTNLQKKITAVYMLDAPGLYPSVLQSVGYQNIKNKIVAIQPQESIVGVMLDADMPIKIVESKSFAFLQHSIFNWQVLESSFVIADDMTVLSKSLKETFKLWQSELTKQELKFFFDTFFDLFFDVGVKSLDDLKTNKRKTFSHLLKEIVRLDSKEKKIMRKSLKTMLVIFNQKTLEKALDYRPEIAKEFLSWVHSDKDE